MKIVTGCVVSGIQRCGREVERDGPDGPPDFEDTLYERGRCCHGDHKRHVSKATNPTRYPFSVRMNATPIYLLDYSGLTCNHVRGKVKAVKAISP